MDWLTALTTLAPSIVAIATIIFAYLQNRDNNKRQLQQLREQQQHEEKKAQIEADSRIQSTKIEKLREIYANSARYLAEIKGYIDYKKIQTPDFKTEVKMHGDVSEANHWLTMLTMYHYDKTGSGFNEFYAVFNNFSSKYQDSGSIDRLKWFVIEFARNDPRLK